MKHYTFVDYATQAYMALVALLILLFHNSTVPNWPGLLGAHLACLVLVHLLIQTHARHKIGSVRVKSSAIIPDLHNCPLRVKVQVNAHLFCLRMFEGII